MLRKFCKEVQTFKKVQLSLLPAQASNQPKPLTATQQALNILPILTIHWVRIFLIFCCRLPKIVKCDGWIPADADRGNDHLQAAHRAPHPHLPLSLSKGPEAGSAGLQVRVQVVNKQIYLIKHRLWRKEGEKPSFWSQTPTHQIRYVAVNCIDCLEFHTRITRKYCTAMC